MSKKNLKLHRLFLEVKIYKKLIGILLKKGLKGKSFRIINEILFSIVKKLHLSFSYLVWFLFKKLVVDIEVRSVKIKGKPYLVPFKITANRQIFLISKWILNSILLNKKAVTIQQKVLEELLIFFLNKKNKILEYKQLNFKNLILSKANVHYRW